jgi:hypothetical protein
MWNDRNTLKGSQVCSVCVRNLQNFDNLTNNPKQSTARINLKITFFFRYTPTKFTNL